MPKNKDEVHFWFELERIEQRWGSSIGSGASRAYDFVERHATQTLASHDYLVDRFNRVGRVRQALDQSGPMAQRLAMQQLSGIDLFSVWDILIAACKEVALYYGGAVVTGAVVGGAVGAVAFGVGAVPGAAIGTAAGAQIGTWVLALLGLKELAVGLASMFPAAMRHYENGFREAWGAAPDDRRDAWSSAALVSGNASAGAWHMAQGHVILVTAILTALVAYLTRGRGNKPMLMQDVRQGKLGSKFAKWMVENERRLLAHPQLQSRPNNSIAMAMGEPLPTGGRGASAMGNSAKVCAGGQMVLVLSKLRLANLLLVEAFKLMRLLAAI